MREKIIEHLINIESDRSVEVLFACESGSRAWGFASEDSDYDVRFIYRRYLDDYLTVNTVKDTIDFNDPENNIEIHGWDLKKVLALTVKGNAAIREWINSPITYVVNQAFLHSFISLNLHEYNDLIPLQFHYYGLAKNTWHKYINFSTPVVAKKYLYAIRPVLAGLWIMKKDQFPPLDINDLFEIAPYVVKLRTLDIIDLKRNSESELTDRIYPLDYFILNGMHEISPDNNDKPKQKSYKMANEFFSEWVPFHVW